MNARNVRKNLKALIKMKARKAGKKWWHVRHTKNYRHVRHVKNECT